MKNFKQVAVALTAFVVGLGAIALVISFQTVLFYWLWNWLMPIIFKLPEITFWQSLGIVTMITLFTKSNNK